MSSVKADVAQLLGETIEMRHALHRRPELAYREFETSKTVQAKLSEWGIEFVGGLAGGTGVLGRLPATVENASTVALRADMDALPITEETGVEYVSENPGVMHACGHDGHTSILLSTARLLSKQENRPNDVLFLFQPAEEGGAGGKRMCDDGVLDGRVLGNPVQQIYGLHGFPNARVGSVSTRIGPLLASATQMHIHIQGKGSHAAYPHRGIDPIVIAAHLITAIQTVASRTIDPLDSVVVTIGKVEAGVAHNVIPEKATLVGTLRTLNDGVTQASKARIESLAQGVAAGFGGSATVEWEENAYPVTRNDAGATERFRKIARQAIGDDQVLDEPHPSMGGEDFSFYGQRVPACFFWLGILPDGSESYPNLHAPTFDFNDAALATGIELMSELALTAL